MKKVNIQIMSIELILILWYLKDIILKTDINVFHMMITLLIYLCLKVLYYIYRVKKYSKVIMLIIVLYLIITSMNVFDSLAFFMVLNVVQLINEFSKRLIPISLLALFILWFVDIPVDVFMIINIFVYISLRHAISNENRLTKITEERQVRDLDYHRLTSNQLNSSIHESNVEHTFRLEERNDIAQKLHDELGHVLSGSTLQLEAALLVLEHDEEKSRHMLRTVIDNLREGTESIRLILKSIKPETASMNIQTIKTLLSKVKEKSGVDVELIYNNEISELNYKQWYVITPNIKEAMTNMMKYSNASLCKITFERLNKMIKVTIYDNGQGCTTIKKGMGLQGLSERLLSIKGQLILDGSNGFSIVMLIPIERGN